MVLASIDRQTNDVYISLTCGNVRTVVRFVGPSEILKLTDSDLIDRARESLARYGVRLLADEVELSLSLSARLERAVQIGLGSLQLSLPLG